MLLGNGALWRRTMLRAINDRACQLAMRWNIRWLFNATGAVEYWLDEHVFKRGGLHFIKLGRLNISWSISRPKRWVMPPIFDMNNLPERFMELQRVLLWTDGMRE